MRAQRGVSLIEALVALAVMSFGMVAIVGMQATMRQNSDVAKQRSEAVRIAQEAIEKWRAYSVLDATKDRTAFADIADETDLAVEGYTTNTAYSLSRTVTEEPEQNQKVLQVVVAWSDRTGTAQRVTLNTVIARTDPALVSALVAPPVGNPSRRPRGRHAAIPQQAKDMGDGLSAFKPPGRGSSVAWVFNNVTGMIVGVCMVASDETTTTLSSADIEACSDNTTAHLLSGYVRFSTGPEQPTAADAEQPLSPARNLDMALTLTSAGHPAPPTCFDDAPPTASAAALQTAVTYYCAIPANTTRTWSGYLTITPRRFGEESDSAWSIPTTSSTSGTHLLCRYTPATSDDQRIANWQHPRLYFVEYADPAPGPQLKPLAMPPLVNQNFLVIRAGLACPADSPADPASGDFVNSNTLLHRPWP